MLTPRAQRYLATLERLPHVEDLGAVRAALEAAGAPATEALLGFHERYAGYVKSGPDTFIWGLLHKSPRWGSPMELDADRENDLWYVTCADAHPSYALTLDQHGTHYTTAGVPRASSFDVYMEQGALISEFHARHDSKGEQKYRRLEMFNDREELHEVLLARLEGRQVAEGSDEHGTIYVTDELLLEHYAHFDFYAVHVAAGAQPAELDGFRWDRDAKLGLEDLRRDLASRYSSRRYQAVLELRDVKDPAAAELFRMVIRDENPQTRQYAIHGLRELRSREDLPALLSFLDEKEPMGVVNFTIQAVTAIGGNEAQPGLIKILRYPDKYVRRNAVEALQAVGDLGAVPALEGLLGDEEVPMAGPRGDKLTIRASAQAAIATIRARHGA